MTAHADASPSTASIWLQCPASVTRARGRVRRPSVYTSEGSAAHQVAEMIIHGLLPPEKVMVDGGEVEVDSCMVDAVDRYVTYVENLKRQADLFLTEARIKLRFRGIKEPLFGTADTIAYWRKARTGTLEIVDLKYGRGVFVSAIGNPQLRIYALGALDLLPKDKMPNNIRLTVIQPRVTVDPSEECEEISLYQLFDWRDTVLQPALQRLAADDKSETPGEHCRWCVRAGECKTLADMAQQKAMVVFNPKTSTPDASGLDDKQLAAVLDVAELLTAWIGQVRAEASQRLEHGGVIPGWKLAMKRSPRRWVDADKAREVLKLTYPALLDEMLKLDTPAAVERVLKPTIATKSDPASILRPLITNQSSGTTLVREDDSRPAVLTGPKSVFQQLKESLDVD